MAALTNEGTADRAIRVILGIALLLLAFLAFGASTILGIIAIVVGAVMLLTGLVGFCPAYRLVGIRTCKVNPGA